MELVPYTANPNPSSSSSSSPAWSDMFRAASIRRPSDSPPKSSPPPPPPEAAPSSAASDARLALYIAMAHAGLALSLLLLYALHRLLHSFLRPIQWALLCSIPLREAHRALLAFWSAPLRQGIFPALLAVPAAVFRASADTLADARSALFRRSLPSAHLGFRRLLRWLLTFWVFVISYERLGLAALALLLLGILVAAPTASAVRNASFIKTDRTGGTFLSLPILNRLPTIIAIGLIVSMLTGFLTGGIFFSYKIGVEGRDAVMSLKSHVQNSNYAERTGFKQWMDDNDIPGLVDKYSPKLYDTVWDQVENLAVQYNLTEFTDGFRQFLVSTPTGNPSSALTESPPHPYSVKLQSLSVQFKNGEWGEIYNEVTSILRELLLTRDDLVERAKGVAFQGMEMSKRILSSSTMVLGGSANLVFSVALAVVSGAAEVLNFVSQLMVFLWLLYFLITSESGGVTEQVVGMLPMSKSMRDRCVQVIDHAIGSVLLATAKIAMFQGCLTWLLFRLCSVHFLYMSTALAFISPLFPLLPTWLSSVPALLQLFMEGRYIWAIGLAVLHLMLMDYGTTVIQADIPGHNAYLTGLSILGGMTLFPNALEEDLQKNMGQYGYSIMYICAKGFGLVQHGSIVIGIGQNGDR